MKGRGVAVRLVGPQQWIYWPALAAVGLTIVFATPIRLFGFSPPEFVFPLVLAFAWPLIRPSMFAPVVLFVLGLFLDLFWAGPLGLWTLALMGVYGAVLFSRAFLVGQDSPMLFAWWCALLAGVFVVLWLLVALDAGAAPSLWALFLQFVPNVLLFPAVAWMLARFDDGDVRFR